MAKRRIKTRCRCRRTYKEKKSTMHTIGRITVHSEADGIIRAATVKTAISEVNRAKMLCLLPVER